MAKKRTEAPAGVVISGQSAYILMRLVSDIKDINGRAKCSDKYFRDHFMDFIRSVDAMGVYDDLNKGYAEYQAAHENAAEGR